MPADAYLAAVAGALVTVTGLFYKSLLDRIKRSEDREERTTTALEKLTEYVGTLLRERGQD
jgi:hypothetical protein